MDNLDKLSLKQREHMGIRYVPFNNEPDPKITKISEEIQIQHEDSDNKKPETNWYSYILPKSS